MEHGQDRDAAAVCAFCLAMGLRFAPSSTFGLGGLRIVREDWSRSQQATCVRNTNAWGWAAN